MVTDFLVIGGGIIGISIARELKRRFKDSKIILIEKEKTCAVHASGRNSGVLHAGFYYTADSLKAKFTKEGNAQLTEYCEEHKLPINKCGKLVVAQKEEELAQLDELLARGKKNGVTLEEITEKEAQAIEPRVLTIDRAIYSPTTSSVDPVAVVHSMEQDARDEGVEIHYGVKYLGKSKQGIQTNKGEYKAKFIVNAAGLYADKVARAFGFSSKYRILPFKGLYLYSNEPAGSLRTNIYPVPDLRNPFLGVHYTVTVDGKVKIGPTAIPAFWREQYKGYENFNAAELFDVIVREISLFMSSNFDFMKLAFEELKKYSREHMVDLASSLIKGVRHENYKAWGKPGIRAQLVDIEKRQLEMDFVVEGDENSLHVLNAVSPAFTCSFPFSSYVCDKIEKNLN
jgi:L-2-hydroxyglutarate oxidase LhgO